MDRALGALAPGQRLRVQGQDPHLRIHLGPWARARGHGIVDGDVVVPGDAADRRWAGALRAGAADVSGIVEMPPVTWGLAARGALVEEGGPPLALADLNDRVQVWTDLAPKLYAQAAAGQWDPATAIDWSALDGPEGPALPPDVEAAVVQVMTYLIENEQAALVVPARFLGRIHPHFREVVQFLATQIADEARHVEVFTRRATIGGQPLGVSGVGGRASLQTLLEEPHWATASFLLSVLGEGTFLSLLAFIERWAPDPVTERVAHLVLQDEARHVAFAMGHLREHLAADPAFRDRLRAATERRHDALAATAGLAPAVRDALVILAAGSWEPAAIAAGWRRTQELVAEMDEGRRRRLVRLGFSERQADELSKLHTRNFM
ncbi:MAG TPA: ferritin-like domain-containing protein [Acidimicrobiales bacterium]|nr:ferritin-like domain-containing protein [Acidimicrobiales bacterium]